MTDTLVLDRTAIVGLFAGHPVLVTYSRQAEAGGLFLVFPAAAVAEAADQLRLEPRSWAAMHLTPGHHFVDFTVTAAEETAGWRGSLGVRHAGWEAVQMGGTAATFEPHWYDHDRVSILAL